MAIESNIMTFIDNLESSSNIHDTLTELATILGHANVNILRNISANIRFDIIFQYLNSVDEEQLRLVCRILKYLFDAVDDQTLINYFSGELLVGLAHHSIDVIHLCLQQLLRMLKYQVDCMATNYDVISQVLSLLGNDDASVARKAYFALVTMGADITTVYLMFNHNMVDCMKLLMKCNDVVRFRVYEIIVSIASLTSENLGIIESSGMLIELTNEVYKDDILVQLNALELLKDLAVKEYGFVYLQESGIVSKLDSYLISTQSDSLQALLLPGLIKFFGNVAYLFPKEFCAHSHNFIKVLNDVLSENNIADQCLVIETVAHIGSTFDGRNSLCKLEQLMAKTCNIIKKLSHSSPTEIKIKTLSSLSSLIYLEADEHTSEFLQVTEQWFLLSLDDAEKYLLDIAKQPFVDLRCAAFNVLKSLAALPWGQNRLNTHPGFNEYLLDRATEKAKEAMDCKYEVIQTICKSSTVESIFGSPYYIKLRHYLNEGPYYVDTVPVVAYEESS